MCAFLVHENALLSLSHLVLNQASTISFVGNGSTISLTSLSLPDSAAVWSLMSSMQSTAATIVNLNAVTVPGFATPVTGSLASDGVGGFTRDPTNLLSGLSGGSFSVNSGPCTASQGGRCVSRRYSEQDPWPILDSGPHSAGGSGPMAERCEIVVLRAGTLAPSPLFDTVSYGPTNSFNARHDAVGLGSASCAPANCNGLNGGDSGSYHSCYVSSWLESPDPVAPAGCYAGKRRPPPGTVLAVGEAITWAAAGDAIYAYDPNTFHFNGDAFNRASAHGGWELCFA